MNKIDLMTAAIVAKHLVKLMDHYGLTVYGVEVGTGLEVHTINRILDKRTNLSTNSAKKIAAFFDITIDLLFADKPLKLKKLENTPTVNEFFHEHALNKKYFKSKYKENVVSHFLRTVLINDAILQEGQRAGKIAKYVEDKFAKGFKHETVRKELERMYIDGLLDREDKTGSGAVFYYMLKK